MIASANSTPRRHSRDCPRFAASEPQISSYPKTTPARNRARLERLRGPDRPCRQERRRRESFRKGCCLHTSAARAGYPAKLLLPTYPAPELAAPAHAHNNEWYLVPTHYPTAHRPHDVSDMARGKHIISSHLPPRLIFLGVKRLEVFGIDRSPPRCSHTAGLLARWGNSLGVGHTYLPTGYLPCRAALGMRFSPSEACSCPGTPGVTPSPSSTKSSWKLRR